MDRTGQLIAERYQLVRLLERGGQSQVYEGLDLVDGERIAVKVLSDPGGKDLTWRERMFREAQAMARLSGTAAVRVQSQVWTEDGALCLVMELLSGRDLERYLASLEARGDRFSVEFLETLLGPVVSTLEIAHAAGIVHRDLKPANVFVVEPPGTLGVRLLDFGLAKFTRARPLTELGFIAGSPSYIAPETWEGQLELDHRIDVYALGAVIFRCLGGRPPFLASDWGRLIVAVTTAPRPSLYELRPDLPPEVDDWVSLALAVDREQRFQNVSALWNALRGALHLKRGAELRAPPRRG